MNFVTGLSILTNWKVKSNDSICVIIDKLTSILSDDPFKVNLDTLRLVNVITNMPVWQSGGLN